MDALGTSSGKSCDRCGRLNRAAAKFCANCGLPLVAQVAPVQDFYAQLGHLYRTIGEAFDWGELRGLAFELGIADFASLPGETKEGKARELVARMVREDRLPQLLAICRRERPAAVWPFVIQQERSPGAKPLDDVFRQGIRHQLGGDLAAALQVYEGLQRLDPNYPGLQAKLLAVRAELRHTYIGLDGRVIEREVFLNPPSAAKPEATGGLSPAAAPSRRDARVRPIILVALLVLLGLLAAIAWVISQ